MKTLKNYFKQFEEKVVGIEGIIGEDIIEDGIVVHYSPRPIIFKSFNLVRRFIKAQHFENQRDLWLKTIDLLNASKAFNDEIKGEIREDLLVDCFKELENLNNIIFEGNAEKFEESKKKRNGKSQAVRQAV
jgi:hypothetical protein